jgi:hypothetical protein
MTYQAPEVVEVGKAENVILGCAFVGEPDNDILSYALAAGPAALDE